MSAQPCPDCGTLMDLCYDPSHQNDETCWHCQNCGNTWTPEEIEIEYRLNAEMDENTPHPDEGIVE